MDVILDTALKSLISVALLFFFTRIMGKKQISQLTFFDYAAGISIGSIAAAFAVDPSLDYAHGVTSLIVFTAFPVGLTFITMKSFRARRILDGVPMILIQDGRVIEENLRRTQLNINDLLEECRAKNVFDIQNISCAILETGGKLSVLLKPEYQPATVGDLNLTPQPSGLGVNLVLDGRLIEEHLRVAGKDRAWLFAELEKQGIGDYHTVLLAYLDAGGKLAAQLKGDKAPQNPLM